MIPKFGDGFFERLVRLFVSSDLEPRQFSLVGGIWHLFAEREIFIGGVILLFSVVFPVAKLAAIIRAVHLGPEASARHLKMVESLGKWSMVDVFVIASLVICFKGFPGGTPHSSAVGDLCFCGVDFADDVGDVGAEAAALAGQEIITRDCASKLDG